MSKTNTVPVRKEVKLKIRRCEVE